MAASFSHVRARTGSLSPQHFPVAFPPWQGWKSGDSPFPWLCQERRQRRRRAPWPRGPLQVPGGRGASRKHLRQLRVGTVCYRGREGGRAHNFLSPLSRLSCPQKNGGRGSGGGKAQSLLSNDETCTAYPGTLRLPLPSCE